MQSLIICSRASRLSSELEKNIVEIIGSEYELEVGDNSKKLPVIHIQTNKY